MYRKWKNKGHEFDEIGYLLKNKKNVFIYGAGENSKELVELLSHLSEWTKWNIYLVDRDVKKQQEGRFGYEVLSPEKFFHMEKTDYFVIANAFGKAGDEIYELVKTQLKDVIIFKGFYFLYTYLPIYFAYIHDMVFFVSENMLPSTVCNLNCRDCLNFTPFIKHHYVEDLEELKRSVDLFFNAIDLIYRFQITGGEPLLYKNLIPLIEYIDENYREKIIRFEIVTNGTIVPADSVCKIFAEKNMYVFLDDYRMSLENGEQKYKEVYEKLVEYNVSFVDNHVEQWIRMYVPEEDNDRILTEEDLLQTYFWCDNPWSTLWRGKISSCNYAMYAAKAGLCSLNEDEYFDLSSFEKENKKELVEFRLRFCQKGYMDFCNKCGGWTETNKRWCEPAIQSTR